MKTEIIGVRNLKKFFKDNQTASVSLIEAYSQYKPNIGNHSSVCYGNICQDNSEATHKSLGRNMNMQEALDYRTESFEYYSSSAKSWKWIFTIELT